MKDEITILVVEDEPDMLKAIQLRLESIGFRVETALDGLEGLRKAREIRPNLIILDLMLPKMDGYRVCRMLKFDDKYRDIPIIMLTAKSTEQDKALGFDVGADSYITKPFRSKDLLEDIKNLLTK
jgi:DNA-binding response OmpR family regulator